ncbi:MAG TPA: hypothetical protein V6D18_00785, partial [Thermosynechococcaceae cyanobacterium]
MELKRQDTNAATFESFGVDPDTARAAGEVADRQATDPTYVLNNDDLNVRNAAYQQMFQQQWEQQQCQRDEKEGEVKVKIDEYVRLLDQAQESRSVGLVDAAAQIRQQLVSQGLLTEAEFDKRVEAEDEALWTEGSIAAESDDGSFEARWRQETQGIGVPGGAYSLGHAHKGSVQQSDPIREIREEESRENRSPQKRSRSQHSQANDF